MNYMKNIGKNVKYMRLSLGWHQEDLAERVGCSQAHISNIEHGRELSVSLLFKIINALKCHPHDIIK